MIQKIKGMIKEPLIRKQNNRYYQLLDEKVTLYDEWIRYVEGCEDEKHDRMEHCDNALAARQDSVKSAIEQKLSDIRVIEYGECRESFNLAGVKESYIIFTKEKRRMAEGCLSYIWRTFQEHPQVRMLYGDEDEWNSDCSIRMNPWFKPDFSPDTLQSFFYFGNVFAIRTKAYHDIIWRGETDAFVYRACI